MSTRRSKRKAEEQQVADDGLTPFERKRAAQIEANRNRMKDLGVSSAAADITTASIPKPRKAKSTKARSRPQPIVPPGGERRSGRSRAEVDYSEDSLATAGVQFAPPSSRAPAEAAEPREYAPAGAAAVAILPSHDASDGRRNSAELLIFDDHPEFTPSLTPKQVIQAGSFGGIYFNPRGGRAGIYGREVAIDHTEFPADWFEGLPADSYRGRQYRTERNKYHVNAGQNQAAWEGKGWIKRELDPRGWFQWYCRFYLGRRTEDDERQISRWKGVAGEKGRWKRALVNKIVRANARWDDGSISPVIRQTMLHWAFELTEPLFEKMRRGM